MAEKVEWGKIDPKVYISETFFDKPDFRKMRKYILKSYHTFFTGLDTTSDLTILDIGSGPTIAFQISAAQHNPEITLSDFSESFRSVAQKWVDGDPTAQDWTTYFEYVVMELEGERESQLHKAIKAVVACDITKDPPLPSEFMQQYDIVTSTLCLEAACQSRDAYHAAITRIYNLVKPGGRIVIQGAEVVHHKEDVDVKLGQQGFEVLSITREFVKEVMEEIGFSDVRMTVTTKEELDITAEQPPPKAYVFITGSKK